MSAYVYRPKITFEDTNIVGNVYFANFIRWQGACREMFLKDHAPGVLKMVAEGEIILHTSNVTCDFKDPFGISVTDEISVEMSLIHFKGGRLTVKFDYFRETLKDSILTRDHIAYGSQSICCKKQLCDNAPPQAAVFPQEMLLALRLFSQDSLVLTNINEALQFLQAPEHDSNNRMRKLTLSD